MAEDATPAAPMKPQETVIYILGELGGKMSSLSESVNASNSHQATVNAANETEHAEFRKTLSDHATALAIIKDSKQTQEQTRMSRTMQWSLWLGLPTVAATIVGLINWHH